MRLLAWIFALVWTLPVQAANITKTSNLFDGVDILIQGELTEGDGATFRALVNSVLRDGLRVHRVRLNSPGGLVDEALAIGDIVRRLKLDTVAPTKMMWDAVCESACFYIWAAGIDRYGEDIGLHRPYFDPREFARLSPGSASAEYQKLTNLVAGKLEGWGIPNLLVRRMLSASSRQMIPLSPDDFQLLRNDPGFSELVISRCGGAPYDADNASDAFYDDCQIAVLNERLDEGIRQYQGRSKAEAAEVAAAAPIPTPKPMPPPRPDDEQVVQILSIGPSGNVTESSRGTVVWRAISNQDIYARIRVPTKFEASLTIKRTPANNGGQLSISFEAPSSFGTPQVGQITNLWMRYSETGCCVGQIEPFHVARGGAPNSFDIVFDDDRSGLSADYMESNIDSLAELELLCIGLTYYSGQKASLCLHKGEPGRAVFRQVLSSWKKYEGPSEAEIEQAAEVAPDAPLPTPKPTTPDPAVPDVAVATPDLAAPDAVDQKAIFYEERTDLAQGSADTGSIVWSVVQESPGGDLPPEPAIRAEATIPGKDLRLRMTIRRNADPTLPASHIIELIFLTPDGFEGGGIESILRVSLKDSEQAAGNALLSIPPAKIADGFFLVALNDNKPEMDANLNLLRRQQWIDVPLVYKSGRRALITMEKGIPGEKVFEAAIKAWQNGVEQAPLPLADLRDQPLSHGNRAVGR